MRTSPVVALLAAFALAGCGGSNDASSDVPSGSPRSTSLSPSAQDSGAETTPGDMVDVGGRSLFIECHGSGSPTVVLEAGLGGDSGTWDQVAPPITGKTRVCAYDRANTGQSDPAPTPRTTQDIVDDLDALLASAGEQPPFVLVGFSFGGLVTQLYAASHPGDVSGMVLVEANHPDENDVFWSHLTPAQVKTDRSEMQNNPEGVDLPASFVQVQGADELPPVPLVVVTGARSEGWPPGWDPKLFDRLHAAQQRQLARLVPGGEQVIAEHSGHDVPNEESDVVVDAIIDVLSRSDGG